MHTAIPLVSLCEGPYYFTAELAEAAGLDPARVSSTMVGLNHACWSVEHHYEFNDERPEVYDKNAAADAWKRTVNFFLTHLA